MPIRYVLDNENNFVLYEISGIVTSDDVDELSTEVMEKIETERTYSEFFMFTETTAYWAASKDYYEKIRADIVQRDAQYGYKRKKSALVTFDAYGKIAIPLWKTVADDDENYSGETEVFETVETAVEWLGIELKNVEKNLNKIKMAPTCVNSKSALEIQ